MDSTPPYHRSEARNRIKSASRLSRTTQFDQESEDSLHLSLEVVPSSLLNIVNNKSALPSPPSSTLSPIPNNSLPMRELLLLSHSPLQKSKTRLPERLEMAEETMVVEPNAARRRCKNRNAAVGMLGCASPRNNRRSRRRLEQEIREEKDFGVVEEVPKARNKRHTVRSKKDKLSLALAPPIASSKGNESDGCNFEEIGQLITDLVMWRDVAKSSLWFGLGSLCFLSSCFAGGISFSIFSVASQLGLLLLALSFLSSSICHRDNMANKHGINLTEDDVLRVVRKILPAANFTISKARELFSGEPSMTLKVAPFLLIGAEYGHVITLWRLFALGFFVSFIGPKLYSAYSAHINSKVEYVKRRVVEAWEACSHKKIVAASAATAFWNLTSIRTRIFAAFISLVILRHCRQYSQAKVNEEVAGELVREQELQEQQKQQALVVVETETQN